MRSQRLWFVGAAVLSCVASAGCWPVSGSLAGEPRSVAAPRSIAATSTPAPSPSATPHRVPAPKRTPPDHSAERKHRARSTHSPGTRAGGGGRHGCGVSAILVPSCGALWGVAPGAFTDAPKPKALANFERKVGRRVDIVHLYHRGDDLFPTHEEIAMARHGRLLYLNWKPEFGTGRTWAEVAHGAVDGEIDRLASYIDGHYHKRFFLTIHHEPEDDVRPSAGSGYTAKDYAAMFRHVAKRLRADGVDNAVTVMNYMGAEKWGEKPWFGALYPGDRVVDWIAYDPYAGDGTTSFAQLVNKYFGSRDDWPGFYTWATRTHPDKPLMLGEWGVFAQRDDPSHKASIFRSAMRQARHFPRIKAYVYFGSPQAPRGDTTVDSTSRALRAFRALSDLRYFRLPVLAHR
ncbi:MAG: hypothetical protein ACRDN9_12435 [Streptosporangiaceae bacterium]